jgi:hypothetical protein
MEVIMDVFGNKKEASPVATAPVAVKAERKPLTKEQKDALDARKAVRKAAFDKLRDIAAKALKDGLFDADTAKAVTESLTALTPLRSNEPVQRETMFDKIARMFKDKKALTGFDVYNFEACHYGASDMRRNIILALKTADADKRMWIEYDAKNDVYTKLLTGATPPLGWVGFVPVDAVPDTGAVPKA